MFVIFAEIFLLNRLLRITTVPLSLRVLLKGQLAYVNQYFEVLAVSSPGAQLKEVATLEKVRTAEIAMSRKITPWKDLKSLIAFYRLCKKEKPLIVHSHTPKAGIVGMLGAWLAGVPIRMHTVAGLPLMEATGKKRKLLNGVEKLTYRFATDVYPNSKGLYDFILNEKLTTANKLKIIANGSSNGIDTTHFSPEAIDESSKTALRASLGLKEDDFVFIFVGRLVSDKGINELISAFSALTHPPVIASEAKQSHPKLNTQNSTPKTPKLLLVGPLETDLDPLRSETLEKIENHPGIISVGFQSDVRPYFAISDCLAFPSYREGFPNVVMQAGAMDLPSIVTDINGCKEIIEDGKNGLIVPPKSSEALQGAMQHMLTDTAGREKMAAVAREKITSRYEQHIVWQALLNEYNRLIAEVGV